jgi:hypothetical protein
MDNCGKIQNSLIHYTENIKKNTKRELWNLNYGKSVITAAVSTRNYTKGIMDNYGSIRERKNRP